MDTTYSILRSARSFFAGTVLSRISGMLREIAMAFCFGASPQIAAFMVAYRLANLFRRLLGEGNLQAGFAPQFEAARTEGKEAKFYRDTAYSMGIVLLGTVLLLSALLWLFRSWAGSSGWGEIAELSMWMAPGLFFICLNGLNSSALQCEKSYFITGAAPVLFNAVWIAVVLAIYHLPEKNAVRWLAIGVAGAFFMQWALTALSLRKRWGKQSGLPELFSNDWKKILKPMALGIVGIGAVQFNSALDAIFARIADPSGPSFLWYAIRIQQLPLALFGIALSGALLPPLARTIQQGSLERYRELLQSALRYSIALMLPCTFGILALSRAGVNLLYGHGVFSPEDVRETALCLSAYGIGLVPSVFVLLLAAGFYAQKSYRIPARASVISVLANIGLNGFFVFGLKWGAVSIALATSASAFVNAALLGNVFTPAFWRYFLKMGICSAIPAAVTLQVERFWISALPRDFSQQLVHFAVLGGVYLVGLALLAWKFKLTEFLELFRGKRPQISNNY